MKISKSCADSKVLAVLDRDSCFKIVAGAFKDVAKNSSVDLKSPEVITFNLVIFTSLNSACSFSTTQILYSSNATLQYSLSSIEKLHRHDVNNVFPPCSLNYYPFQWYCLNQLWLKCLFSHRGSSRPSQGSVSSLQFQIQSQQREGTEQEKFSFMQRLLWFLFPAF